jgi:hypothetical protein
VLSACDAWAVGGFTDAQGIEHALTEHWNGASWTVVRAPDQGSTENFLEGVRAASRTSIWAVGGSDNGGAESPVSTLILHWDGKHWSRQGTPVPGILFGVRSVSSTEAWAVGTHFATMDRPLVLHLAGGTWRNVSIPSVADNEDLDGVAASSPADVWAVGTAFNGTDSRHARTGHAPPVEQPFVVHWNGRTWTHVTAPGTGALNAVGVGSRTSALAVGEQDLPDGSQHTLALRWNGKTWTDTHSPSPVASGVRASDIFTGVTVTARGTAWAVGKSQDADGDVPLIERWDGSRWTTVPAPDTGFSTRLNAVAASSASSVWAVGWTSTPANTRLALAERCC